MSVITAYPCECVVRESCCCCGSEFVGPRLPRAGSGAERTAGEASPSLPPTPSSAATALLPPPFPLQPPPVAAAGFVWRSVSGSETSPRNNGACASTRQPLRCLRLHSRKCRNAAPAFGAGRSVDTNGRWTGGWAGALAESNETGAIRVHSSRHPVGPIRNGLRVRARSNNQDCALRLMRWLQVACARRRIRTARCCCSIPMSCLPALIWQLHSIPLTCSTQHTSALIVPR